MTESRRPAEIIEIADQLELRVIDIDTGVIRRYKSSMLDLTDKEIAIGIPTDQRIPVSIPDGTAVVVAIWKDFADLLFKARVLRKVGGRVPQLILSRPAPEEITRTTRRGHFRVDTKIPTRVRLIENGEQVTLPAIMLDLSGGGCRLQTRRHLQAETPVQLDFDLPFPPDNEGLDRTKPLRQLPGKVKLSFSPAEARKSSRARQSVHLTGIEFDKLDNVVQNSLLRYIAFRQREVLNQFQEGAEEDRRTPSAEVDEIQDHLGKLEQDLKEAGQEVPEAVPVKPPTAVPEKAGSPQAPVAPQEEELPPPGSIDELFTQPLTREESASAPSATPPLQPLGGTPSGKTILLVEDEEDLRQVLAEALQQEGYAIIEAANGQEALKVALQTHVDLIITDLMMPRMNGWRLLTALRERGRDVPVIIITAYMNEEGQEVLTSRDITNFLVKPIDLDDMTAMVDDVFSSPENRPRRILAVDDEEDARLLVSACLEKAGFVVETATGGKEALARVENFRPDLVLLDIVMPGMDGFEICRRLRSKPVTARIPMIMITVKSSAEYVKKSVSLRINGYIVKPFDPDVLIERVRKILQLKAPA